MNDKIFELMKVKGAPDEIVAQIETFASTNGPTAMKQLERVVRQRKRYNQIMDIIDEDRGYDPRREAEITIGESTIHLQSYDEELQTILEAPLKNHSCVASPAVCGPMWIAIRTSRPLRRSVTLRPHWTKPRRIYCPG